MPVMMKDGVPSAPIPGSSLTKEPKAQPWERPPKFVNPHEAAEFIWLKMMKPDNFAQIITLLENGMAITSIAHTILYACVMQGQFTLDVAYYIREVVVSMVAAIGVKAEIKVKLYPTDKLPGEDSIFNLEEKMLSAKQRSKLPDKKPAVPAAEIAEVKKQTRGLLEPLKDAGNE